MAAIPVILFAYARPAHLVRVLGCLRENEIPLLYAFADGARGADDAAAVAEVRALLRAVTWCDVRLTERRENLGLGRNVLAGVSDVAERHEAFIVWEDDLICVPGTYAWLCAALQQYASDDRVMSVSAWTHPRVTPADVGAAPYFDARADCWVWGAWARSWRGMPAETAGEKMAAAAKRGVRPDAFGADLPVMAREEARKNIWAVRWLYHHLARGGLCLRPPWSMVEHIGFDAAATHAGAALGWANPPLRPAPPRPDVWPPVARHPDCQALWTAAAGSPGIRATAKRLLRRIVPEAWLEPIVRRFFRVRWQGDFPDWAAARRSAGGYETREILERVSTAARAVRDGRATYERDGVAFQTPPPPWPALEHLRAIARRRGGRLAVLDFGGALGSLYWQLRAELAPLGDVRWRIVEQPALVERGQAEFANGQLEFYSTIREACDARMPDVVVLASVLPYVEAPLGILRELAGLGAEAIVVERTGFTTGGGTRLTIQHVPANIYRASYPCWFLDRAELLAALGRRYRLVHEARDDVATPPGLEFRTLHFVAA